MLRLAVCVGLCLHVVLSDPATTAASVPGVPTVPTSPAFVNPNLAGYPAYSGYNGYRSPYNAASPNVPIISYSNNRGPDGSYAYSFATADGKQAQESGFLKDAYIDNTGSPQGTQVVEGSYAYTSPEGTPIQVSYVADENGFRPAGVHIPADGKGVAPALLGNGVAPGLLGNGYNNIYDPRHNRFNNYDPRYNGFNKYQNPYNYNQYNPARPFDARYNPYNPYRNVKNIKKTLLALLVLGVVAADVRDVYYQQQVYTTEPIPILRQEQIINPDGSYRWNYETANGIAAEEEGVIKNAGIPEQESLSAQGQYQYTAPDGQIIQLQYVADENGFQPRGAHLPTPPPIPEEIQRALDHLATLPTPGPELNRIRI
ncbi:unnamed protein product [Pieris macdunnoughi]|uniref:Uncharacterized protein n=1 Tax=Pieris macdunnoughi TaxID=345717 RepID=A0A821N419_9NEOP|nr:unnamed protein product [Pieris macdunnoughi]